ncbi:uncharacterized protein ARMOST_02725 [Armillaria ostoyae]|uniref:Uncharacterized protein n=1 Tax=Armillaria ostoyae TaxID=47428 RepID=A0A284QSH1_ARMOS|nr:uncharacterized protein ARMOST_02725 [Armillaria ostoyae]
MDGQCHERGTLHPGQGFGPLTIRLVFERARCSGPAHVKGQSYEGNEPYTRDYGWMSLIIESLTGGSWTLGTGPPNHLVHRNFSRLSIPITDVPSTNVRAAGLLLVPGTAQEGALFSGHRSRRRSPPEKVVASSQPFALSLNRWTPNGRQAPQELIMLFVASSFDDRTFL